MHLPARRHALLGGIVFFAGCATSAPLNGGLSSGASVGGRGDPLSDLPAFKSTERSNVSVPLAVSWSRLAKAYSDLGISLTTVSGENYVLGNEGMRRSHTLANDRLSSFLDCGTGGSGGANADIYAINMSVVSGLRALTDSTTEVATLVQATATPMSLGSPPVVCGTTGSLESRISSMVSGTAPTK